MMQSAVASLSRKGRWFMYTTTKSSTANTFSKRRQIAANNKSKKQAHETTAIGGSTPCRPFGLSKGEIIQLKKSIESSHQEFCKDWTQLFLTSTYPEVIDGRKYLRRELAKTSRNMSLERIGLWGTAKNILTGNALHTRVEEEGVREATDEYIVAKVLWGWELMTKKALYDFPAIYSHILDEIFNQDLFASDDKASNYLVESCAVSEQLAQALMGQSNARKEEGITTHVKVRVEASPPTVCGYSTRVQNFILQDEKPLPKTLSRLHIPGGSVYVEELPLESVDMPVMSVCVHVMLHTHETYTFRQQQHGEAKSAKLDTPRILTFNSHFVFEQPSESFKQTLNREVELAAFEDRVHDLFAHNPTKYKKVYPDGNPLNKNFGIEWQLVDIDFLVARSRGWVAFDKDDGIQIKDCFCYQPPVGYLNYDKEDVPVHVWGDQRVAMTLSRALLLSLFATAETCLLLVLVLAFIPFSLGMTELPESVKAALLKNGYSDNDIELLEFRLFPMKAIHVRAKESKDGDEQEEFVSNKGSTVEDDGET